MITAEFIVIVVTVAAGVMGSSVYVASAILYARLRSRRCEPHEEDVTVIVAARNEERRLPALIDHLLAQTYPRERFRVIIADDRSADKTGDIARAAALPGLNLEVVRIDSVPAGVSPKKHALDTAVNRADTELLLFTDADCRPGPSWIQAMTARFSGADVVLGVSPVASPHALVDGFVRYESARTALLSVAAAAAGKPYMAVGRNWGYRASLYRETGGLAPLYHVLGGDDDLLLQRFVRHGARVAVCADPRGVCPSDGPASPGSLIRQKLRHYGASRYYAAGAKWALAGLHAAQFLALAAGPVVLVVLGAPPLPTAACIAMKLAIDSQCVCVASAARPSVAARMAAIPLEWTHAVASAVLGLIAQWKKPAW